MSTEVDKQLKNPARTCFDPPFPLLLSTSGQCSTLETEVPNLYVDQAGENQHQTVLLAKKDIRHQTFKQDACKPQSRFKR